MLQFANLTIPPAGSINGAASGSADRQIAVAGSRSVVPLVYGEDRLGALILNVLPAAAGSSVLLVQCLWSFAGDGVSELRLNDQPLPAGSTVTTYTGSQTTADSSLVAAFAAQSITYADTLAGYQYSVVAIPMRAVEGQLSISGKVRGRKVYDPRKDSTVSGGSGVHRLADPATWEWSDCPALALGDFLRSTVYGCSLSVNSTSVQVTANANDASVGSPAEKRRTLGVSFVQATPVLQIAEALRAYAGCWLVPGSSGVRLVPDSDAAAVATFSHDLGQILSIGSLRLRDLGDVPTVVEVLYTDTRSIPWREGSAVAQIDGAGSTKPWRLSQVRLPGIHRHSQAVREATERLNKLTLQQLTTELEVFDEGLRIEEADVVSVTHPVGLTAKSFRVTAQAMVGPGRWRLDLVEHNGGVYSSSVVSPPPLSAPAVYSPQGAPGNVSGLSGTVGQGIITWSWSAPTEQDAETRLRIGGASWNDATPLWSGRGTSLLQRVTATGAYTLRARHAVPDGVGGWLESASASAVTVNVTEDDLVQSEPGAPGLSQAMVELYQWGSASQPADPSGTSVWTWSTSGHASYTGGGGWSTSVGSNPGTAGSRLWVARKAVSAAVGTTSTSVDWTGGFTVYAAGVNGQQGPAGDEGSPGSPGIKAATPTVWRWAATIPTISGTSTYTWAAADTGLVPAGWSSIPGAGSAGQTLWGATVQLVDAAGSATTTIDWSAASISARGYAGNNGDKGDPGQPGVSARRAYVLTGLSSLGAGTVTSTGSSSLPANGSFGVSGWTATPSTPTVGQTLYQSDGLYNPVTNVVTWETPYISALKVGSLAALAVNTGALTVDGALTVGAGGQVASSNYSVGISGWALSPTGAEFPAASIRGQVVAAQIDGRGLVIRDNDGNAIFGVGTKLDHTRVDASSTWLNTNVGAVNMLWGAQNGPLSAGPTQYGSSPEIWIKSGSTNPHGIMPGEVLTVSSDLWQDSANASVPGNYAVVYLWAQDSGGNWWASASFGIDPGSTDKVRGSATLTIPSDPARSHSIGLAVYHQPANSPSHTYPGTVYADRVQVERGGVATQYKPGAQPGATVGAPPGTLVGSIPAQDVESQSGATAKSAAAQSAAIAAAAADATAKANAAQSTAQAYALAQANLAEVTAKAYADGIVDAEEARAIADAQAKADAAQAAAIAAAAADATAKANAAQAAAIAAANAGLAAKLNKDAADTLSATLSIAAATGAGFRAGNLTWDSAGNRTGGSGVAMTPGGLVGHNGSRTTFVVNASTGEASFSDKVTLGKDTYGSGTGILLEWNGGTPRIDVGNSTKYIRWSGSDLIVGGDIIATGNIVDGAVRAIGGSELVSDTQLNNSPAITICSTSVDSSGSGIWMFAQFQVRNNEASSRTVVVELVVGATVVRSATLTVGPSGTVTSYLPKFVSSPGSGSVSVVMRMYTPGYSWPNVNAIGGENSLFVVGSKR